MSTTCRPTRPVAPATAILVLRCISVSLEWIAPHAIDTPRHGDVTDEQLDLCKTGDMSTYRAQVHIDAPLDEVWALVGNPATYPQWWPVAVEIRGERFELGDPFTQVVGIAGRRLEYSRIIDRREELKELRWHCPTTGGFQHWLLTDAQGGTFVDMEMGLNPPTLRYGLFDKTMLGRRVHPQHPRVVRIRPEPSLAPLSDHVAQRPHHLLHLAVGQLRVEGQRQRAGRDVLADREVALLVTEALAVEAHQVNCGQVWLRIHAALAHRGHGVVAVHPGRQLHHVDEPAPPVATLVRARQPDALHVRQRLGVQLRHARAAGQQLVQPLQLR